MALIQTPTGTYDDSGIYTAWDLAGDWWWNEAGYEAVIVGGRTPYETATATTGRFVRLWRLRYLGAGQLTDCYRYVDPETPMRLVKLHL